MSNQLYTKGKEKILQGQINFMTDDIKATLVSSAYTLNIDTHEFLSDINAYVVDTPVSLTGKSVTGGMFDAQDPMWEAVAAGPTIQGVAIYKDTTVAGTSPLLAWFDTITGFPFAANGSNVVAMWDNGSVKIIKL